MASLSLADRAGRSVWRLLPKRTLSGVIGWGARRSLPAALRPTVLGGFARRCGIDVGEAEKGLSEYAGIDDFFARRLRPGARPIDSAPGVVVHPADGTVVEGGVAEHGRLIQAKGIFFTLGELLLDEALAARLAGGPYAITYLSPRDYHRVHAPVAGRVVASHHIPGTLFSVNARSVVREPGLYARNERFVTVIEGETGLCVVVMVAAVGVGHMTAAYDPDVRTHAGDPAPEPRLRRYDPPIPVERGAEIGTFHLGSTTIVLFEPGRVALDPAPAGTGARMGTRLGQVIA
jgi:phosphatidylserine decarboxylase